jgi:hypothetical protein
MAWKIADSAWIARRADVLSRRTALISIDPDTRAGVGKYPVALRSSAPDRGL